MFLVFHPSAPDPLIPPFRFEVDREQQIGGSLESLIRVRSSTIDSTLHPTLFPNFRPTHLPFMPISNLRCTDSH